jgi:phenylalanyl-tRNA synthetase alpha chain
VSDKGEKSLGEQLDEIKVTALNGIENAATTAELEEIRIGFLGKKGELTRILKMMGGLSAEERPLVGKLANEARFSVESALEEAKKTVAARELEARLESEKIDVTAFIRRNRRGIGTMHPMTRVINEISDIFIAMGYRIAEGPEIEEDYYNFEALNIPANHPTKDEQDTFYINDRFVLRTHTSGVQIRTMEKTQPPVAIIAPGKTFRSDDLDMTHTPVFHQCEGLFVNKGVTFAHLKGALGIMARNVYGPKTRIRLRPSFFPFTEPSAEMDVSCHVCGGEDELSEKCSACKGSGWIEALGCGMVHPRVLEMAGIDPEIYTGFAFGMGLERIAMARYGIDDIRMLFENDVRFLRQIK